MTSRTCTPNLVPTHHPRTAAGGAPQDRARQDTHGKGEGIAWVPRALGEDALTEERGEARLQSGVIVHRAQKTRGEEEEGLRCLVVSCEVEVGAMREHAKDPVER